MKYTDISIETARKICKKHTIIKPKSNYKFEECEKCPLRRERMDEKGKKHTLICYYILLNLISTAEEIEKMTDINIKYEEDLLKDLKEKEK